MNPNKYPNPYDICRIKNINGNIKNDDILSIKYLLLIFFEDIIEKAILTGRYTEDKIKIGISVFTNIKNEKIKNSENIGGTNCLYDAIPFLF